MSRVIKFRAWCETDEGDEMVYFGKAECDNGLWFDAPKHISGYHAIMQFTGLLDKNGKEIYEGDITKSGRVIMWNKEKALFAEHFQLVHSGKWAVASYPIDSKWIEVIGDIHSTPHLIK